MQQREVYEPQPGDYFLAQIKGFGGFLIRVAQLLTGDASRYTHAGVVLDDGTVVQAEPGGATVVPLAEILDKPPVAYSRLELTDQERAAIVKAARSYAGVPYSFLDYLYLALTTLGVTWDWVTERVQNDGHMICSQLVDQAYQDAGVHLFEDGRFPGDVTPGDLAHVGTTYHVNTGPYFEEL
jgi:uncharacterized protein YycO